MPESIVTNLLGRRVTVAESFLQIAYDPTRLKHPPEGEIVGLHVVSNGCGYTVLVLHEDGKIEPYPLAVVTVTLSSEDDT